MIVSRKRSVLERSVYEWNLSGKLQSTCGNLHFELRDSVATTTTINEWHQKIYLDVGMLSKWSFHYITDIIKFN